MVAPIFFDAIIYSSLLALLSLGLTLTYMTTKVPNFAHAGFAIIGSYITWTYVTRDIIKTAEQGIVQGLGAKEVNTLIRTYTLTPGDYVAIIILSFIFIGIIGVLQYVLLLRPLSKRGMTEIGLMIATISVDMFILATVNIYADYIQESYNSWVQKLVKEAGFRLAILVKTRDFVFFSYDKLESLGVQGILIIAPLLALGLIATLHLLLTRTKLGIALRASIENPMLASVVGINVNLVYIIAWFLSAGLAGAAGALLPLKFLTNPALGQILIVSIFAASIVGGLNALYGSFLGGILIGVSETLVMNFLSQYLGINPGYRPMIPLTIMAITLLLLPEGLGGADWKKIKKKFLKR